MKLAAALLVLAATACSGSLRHVNRAGAVLATAALACDYGQTRSAAAAHWEGHYEANPVMGTNPSTSTVDMYFAATAVVVHLGAQLLPERIRPLAYAAVIGVQAHAIHNNLGTTQGLCGI